MARTAGHKEYVTRHAIDPSSILRAVRDDSAGGTVLFLGTVRNSNEGRRVELLEYEAYREMAEKRMREIESEVKRRWPVKRVRMVHREGTLKVGEITVAVAVTAKHRAEAFEACRYAIDRIKRALPIWKREKVAGSKEVWLEGVPIEG